MTAIGVLRYALLAVLAGLSPSVVRAFGVDEAAAAANRTEESTCVPINFRMFRMTQPDGVRRAFLRDGDDPDVLHVVGGGPWAGMVRGDRDMINVVTRPGSVPDETEFCFVGGHLRFMSVSDRQRTFDPAAYASGRPPLTALWPSAEPGDDGGRTSSIWRGSRRLAFLSRNPNRSALLFAHLALVALGLAFSLRRVGLRLVCAGLATGFFALLAMTASRGGLLACAAGAGALVWFRLRGRMTCRAVAGLVFAGCVAAGAALASEGGRRMLSDLACRDLSAASRVHIWRAFPAMFRAAPCGWGWGRSGFAYNDWFEDLSRHHSTGDLFNDHLSRLAEFGLPGGAFYLFAWFAVLGSAWWSARRGRSPVPLAVWTALAVAGCFNPVQVWGWAWLVPVAALPWIRTSGRCLAWSAGGAPMAVLLVWGLSGVLAGTGRDANVSAHGGRVCFGGDAPAVWIADDDYVLNGGYPGFLGKEIRTCAARGSGFPAVGVVRDCGNLPRSGMKVLLLAGRTAVQYLEMPVRPEADRIVFLSPPFGPERIPEDLRASREVLLICGEFAAARMGLGEEIPDWMAVVPGAELYVPGWTKLLLP